MISNLNILDYKHVQIKQPVKITTLNANFRVFLVKILLCLSPLAAILNFWRPSWIFVGSSGIETSNWNTSFLIIYQKDAISKNYSLKFEFQGVNW